jgi:hypothetical protein
MKIKVILLAILMILAVPMISTPVLYLNTMNVKDHYFHYLRAGQFEKLVNLVKNSDERDIPQLELNKYFDGNKIAEFYLYLKKDSIAYDLFQRLIGTAATENKLDSALFIAESWAKSMPNLELPKATLEKVLQIKKAQEKNS